LAEDLPKKRAERALTVGDQSSPSKLADTSANLELRLEKEVADRRRERFLWICACVALSQPLIYKGCDESLVVYTTTSIIEVGALAAAASLCGLESAAKFYSAVGRFLMRFQSAKTNDHSE